MQNLKASKGGIHNSIGTLQASDPLSQVLDGGRRVTDLVRKRKCAFYHDVLTPFYPYSCPFPFQSQLVITSHSIAMPFSKLPRRPRLVSALIASRRRSHSLPPLHHPHPMYDVFKRISVDATSRIVRPKPLLFPKKPDRTTNPLLTQCVRNSKAF